MVRSTIWKPRAVSCRTSSVSSQDRRLPEEPFAGSRGMSVLARGSGLLRGRQPGPQPRAGGDILSWWCWL